MVETGPSLVVGVSTRALFDLEFENEIFETEGLGLPAFRAYQREHETDPVAPGTAYPLVRDLLALNERSATGTVVEVVVLSRNDPDAAMRVFRSIDELRLPITRGAFLGGRDPWPFVETYGCHLLLSADPADVIGALNRGTPAALVRHHPNAPMEGEGEVRIAFDADQVLFDGASDALYRQDAAAYFRHEREHAKVPLNAGPFEPFLRALSEVQRRFPEEAPPIRTAVVTARTAPAHMRVINTFRAWDVKVDEFIMLGSTPKIEALKHLRPHLFFDDRRDHVELAAATVPSAQVLSTVLGETEQIELFEPDAAAGGARRRTTSKRPVRRTRRAQAPTPLSTFSPSPSQPPEPPVAERDLAPAVDGRLEGAATVDDADAARSRSAQ